MSHFTVMVIGENPETQLAPYNEQPEIGSKYLVFDDKTDEYKTDYETDTVKDFYDSSSSSWGQSISKELFSLLKSNSYDFETDYVVERKSGLSYFKLNNIYKSYEMDGKEKPVFTSEIWFKVIKIKESSHPDRDVCFEGIIRVKRIEPPKERAVKEVYTTFEDYMENYHEIKANAEGRYGYFNNPNAKWDWYQLGGRLTGKLRMKELSYGLIGEHSLVSEKRAKVGYADSALKSEIDFEGMKVDARIKAEREYEEAMDIIGGLPINKTWDEVKKEMQDMEQARDFYWSQPRCKAWKLSDKYSFYQSPDDFTLSKQEYVKNAEDGCLSTFAIIKNGVWYQKGEMGWWGIATEEMSQKEWDAQLSKMLDELPDDILISIYDCHI